MPLLPKKSPQGNGAGSYPKQAAAPAYPVQGAYQTQQAPPGAMYEPPPPYSPYANPVGPPPPQMMGAPNYGAQPGVYGQPYYPGQMYQPMPYVPPAQTVVVQGGFDAGARFDSVARPNIPPPPPGVMPNAAQIAQARGSNVVVTQRPGDFFTGGSDGGYTFW